MSHHIYATNAIILGDMPRGENSRFYILLTEELGVLYAEAVGVRLLKSKLRFSLSLYSSVNVELVRGKNTWRLVNAYPLENETFYLSSGAASFARLALLTRRLVHGEEANERLYAEMSDGRTLLKECPSDRERHDIELVAVARMLASLGYLHEDKYPNIVSGRFDALAVGRMQSVRRDMVKDINLALKESHL